MAARAGCGSPTASAAESDAVIACMPAHVFAKLAPQLPHGYVRRARRGTRWQWAMCYVMALDSRCRPSTG